MCVVQGQLLWDTTSGAGMFTLRESAPAQPHKNKPNELREHSQEKSSHLFWHCTGKPTKPLFLLLASVSSVSSRIPPVNSVFLSTCLLPFTCVWLVSCPRCFPNGSAALPVSRKVTNPFSTIKTHLKLSAINPGMPWLLYVQVYL